MRKLMQIVAFSCLITGAGAVAARSKNEVLNFELQTNWKVGSSGMARGVRILEYVPAGDDINNWKELFTYQNGSRRSSQHTPEEQLNSIKALREKECPGMTEWDVIEQNESSILYEWRAKPCLGFPEQHEIARIIYAKNNWFMLHYVAKVHELAPDTRTKWIKVLKDAALESDADSAGAPKGIGDVDANIPFTMDNVMAALKPAMESVDCKVTEETPGRIECKRPRGFSGNMGYGGESITALVETKGDQTRVRISTGLGFYGRLGKKNWSMQVYQEMVNHLQKPQS